MLCLLPGILPNFRAPGSINFIFPLVLFHLQWSAPTLTLSRLHPALSGPLPPSTKRSVPDNKRSVPQH